jgi:long-chain acyl-CoA synthetase
MGEHSHHTLPNLLLERAEAHGDRVALRKKAYGIWHDISWRSYADHVRRVALSLGALGHERGECVAIISENRPEWLYVDLGTQAAGGITAAVYTTNAAEQVAYIVGHSRARIFFVENEEQLDKALEIRGELPHLERIVVFDMEGLRDFEDPMVMSFEEFLELGGDGEGFEEGVRMGRPQDTALLVYTSGTTGPPKGAMLSHSNLIETATLLGKANPIYETDEVLSFLPLCHIAERLMTVVNQIRFGYTVSFAESLETVSDNLREVSPTVFFAVPRIWEKFHSRVQLTMDDSTWFKKLCYRAALGVGEGYVRRRFDEGDGGRGLATLLAHLAVYRPLRKKLGLERTRVAISGAAPISSEILRYFHAIGIEMREVYGQTEGSGPTTIHAGGDIRLGTVGRPLPGTEVRIGDDGEILVRGPHVFQGYFRNEEATREVLVDGWLHSGDVGEMDADGFLRITDRKKDLIITAGGKNIAPQNIENRLKFSPYINDAVVIGDRRRFLSALVLIDEENVTDWAQQSRVPFTTYADLARNPEVHRLIEAEVDAVNRELAAVERIKKFTILDKRLEQEDGELTPTMKVKRKKISEIYKDLIEEMYR